jgi:hypothetical protein
MIPRAHVTAWMSCWAQKCGPCTSARRGATCLTLPPPSSEAVALSPLPASDTAVSVFPTRLRVSTF